MARLKSEAGFTLTELLIVAAILGFTMAAVLGIYQVTQRVTFFATAGEDAQLQGRAVLDRLVADFQLINSGRTVPTGAITQASSTATLTTFTFLADYDNTLDSSGNFISLNAQANAGAGAVQVNAPPSGTSLSALLPCGSAFTLSDGPIAETHSLKSTGCIDAATNTINLATGETLSTWYPSGTFVRSVETVSYRWDSTSQKLCRSVGTACPTLSGDYTDAQLIATGVTNFQLLYNCDPCLAAPPANLDSIRTIRVQISVESKSGDQTVTRTMQVTVRPRNFF